MPDSQSNSNLPGWRIIALAVVIVLLGCGYFFFREEMGQLWQTLAAEEQQLINFHEDHPVLMIAGAFLVYTAVTGASLPGATVMTLMLGWFFARVYGPVGGVAVCTLLVSFASTSGATIAFLVSRYLFRDALQNRYGERLKTFNAALEREGAFYLFSLRLIPAVPFFLLNVVMGLTPIRTTTYWWISQLGMLPGTIVYVWAGSTLPGLQKVVDEGFRPGWTTILAFVILGLFPLTMKKVMQKIRNKPVDAKPE